MGLIQIRYLSHTLTWQEASGAVGDLGTFLPLLVGLATQKNMDVGTSLVFSGLYNIITGMLFDIPMPVQPMKSIAAIALTDGQNINLPQIMSAGITVAAVVLFLGVTRLLPHCIRLTPTASIWGLQLGLGLSLASKGLKLIVYENNSLEVRPWLGTDGLVVGLVAGTFVICTAYHSQTPPQGTCSAEPTGERAMWQSLCASVEPAAQHSITLYSRPTEAPPTHSGGIPAALLLVTVGLALSALKSPQTVLDLSLGPSPLRLVHITPAEWQEGVLRAAIPQLPLTCLNSVIAVCALSEELFPHRPMNPTHVAISVGTMNLVGCWFGALPTCHGAGGLAGQYKFGARSGTSVIMLGVAKLLLGLTFGTSLLGLLRHFPGSLLGVMLAVSGLELASAGYQKDCDETAVLLVTASATLTFASTALGFVAGLVVYALIHIRSWCSQVRWSNLFRRLEGRFVQQSDEL